MVPIFSFVHCGPHERVREFCRGGQSNTTLRLSVREMFLSQSSTEADSEETSDASDGALSLTSTIQSEPQVEYPLEGILAERVIAGVREYLVKWEGYPDERCTWEPEENFQNDSTLPEWIKQKARIEEGAAQPYDVEALEARIERWKNETLDRKARRRQRRLELSVATNLAQGEDYLENEALRNVTLSNESDDDGDRLLDGNEQGRRNSPRRRRYKKNAHSRTQTPGSESDVPQSLVVKLKYTGSNKAGSKLRKIALVPNDDGGLGRSNANASPDQDPIVEELRTNESQKAQTDTIAKIEQNRARITIYPEAKASGQEFQCAV